MHLTNIMVFRDVTFICGKAGVCALGAVVAKHIGDDKLLHYYLNQFKEVKSVVDMLYFVANAEIKLEELDCGTDKTVRRSPR